MLHFPTPVFALALSFVLLLISCSAARFYGIRNLGARDYLFFTAAFYILIMFSGRGVMKEAFMWMTAAFNYVLPCLFIILALIFYEKRSPAVYLFAFCAGASTEQWGAASCAMMFLFAFIKISEHIASLPRTKKGALRKNALNAGYFAAAFSPLVPAAIGLATIFLSPATQNRFVTRVSFNLARDFVRLSEIFVSKECDAAIILIFCAVLSLLPISRKKIYLPFLSSPAALLLNILSLVFPALSPWAFAAFLVQALLAAIIFPFTFFKKTGVFSLGALVSALVMLPADTFEPRVTAPAALLLIIAVLPMILVYLNESPKIRLKKGILYPFLLLASLFVSASFFAPSYAGFYKNHLIERENLRNIREAKETGVLRYNIDYDKRFAMRQMFNDSYFYANFISLYSLEDCDVILESSVYPRIFLNGEPTGLVAPVEYGETYIPIAAIARAVGGEVAADANIVSISIGGKTLLLKDKVFEYAATRLDSTDLNTKRDFYTLSVVPEIIENAFDIKITVGEKRVDVELKKAQ